jgi:hypothetical protein
MNTLTAIRMAMMKIKLPYFCGLPIFISCSMPHSRPHTRRDHWRSQLAKHGYECADGASIIEIFSMFVNEARSENGYEAK